MTVGRTTWQEDDVDAHAHRTVELLADIRARRARCDYRGARAAALAAVDPLTGAGGGELVGALVELAWLQDIFGEWDSAEVTMERALQAARALPAAPDSEDLTALALAGLAGARAKQWKHEQAQAALLEARPLAASALVRFECLLAEGQLAIELGEHVQALALMQEALAAAEAVPPGYERDRALVFSLAGVGAVHRAEGRFEAGAELFARAIALAEQALGERSFELAQVLTDLGMNGKYSGRFEEAEPLYRRAEAILEQITGTSVHPDIATLYHNLGGLEHARGNYEQAEAHARRSVTLRRASVGGHPVVVLDEGALAAILDARGNHDEAEALLRSTIATLEATFGPENHELAVAINNLAAIRQRRGELGQAEALYRRALEIKRALLGPEAPELGATLNNLATVLKARGSDDQAEALYRQALALMRAGLQPTHPSIARCVRNYATLLKANGRTDEAAALEAGAHNERRGHEPSRKGAAMDEPVKPTRVDEDTEGHRIALNMNETVAEEPPEGSEEEDTEGHRLAVNVNETVAEEPAEEDTEEEVVEGA